MGTGGVKGDSQVSVLNGRIGHGTQEREYGGEDQGRKPSSGLKSWVTVSHPHRGIQVTVERRDWSFCPLGDPEL